MLSCSCYGQQLIDLVERLRLAASIELFLRCRWTIISKFQARGGLHLTAQMMWVASAAIRHWRTMQYHSDNDIVFSNTNTIFLERDEPFATTFPSM